MSRKHSMTPQSAMVQVKGPNLILEQVALHAEPTQTPKSNTGSLSLEYVAEGAANVIFAIRIHSSYLERYDNAYVLRLRKDLSFTVPTSQAIEDVRARIAPLFDQQSWFLTPVLVRLDAAMVESLNAKLMWMEEHGHRWPESRHGAYLPDINVESSAILLPNLYHGEGTVVEFKPKWLTPSPSAPKNAIRCRTCALNLMRRADGQARGRGDSGVCPLDLLSTQAEILSPALKPLWQESASLTSFMGAFRTTVQPVLHRLLHLQTQHDRVGLRDFLDPQDLDFSVAMALRDCSIFLKVVASPDERTLDISLVKILDLDLKQTSGGKIEKWASMEQKLLDGGWYTKVAASDYHLCALARTTSAAQVNA